MPKKAISDSEEEVSEHSNANSDVEDARDDAEVSDTESPVKRKGILTNPIKKNEKKKEKQVKVKKMKKEEEEEEEEPPKKKKAEKKSEKKTEKKVRKKPAYQFFCDDERPKIRKEHSDWKLGDISKELGKRWKASSESTVAKYQKKADAYNKNNG